MWLPDDPADPVERLVVESSRVESRVAVDDSGVALVVWVDRDGRALARRIQRGVGVLDAAAILVGGGVAGTDVDAAVGYTGSAFLVAIGDVSAGEQSIHRVTVDGSVTLLQAWSGVESVRHLVRGAPGHLLISSIDTLNQYRYLVVEVDVPDGGACSDAAACQSGVCTAGVCEPAGTGGTTTPPVAATGDTGTGAGVWVRCSLASGGGGGGVGTMRARHGDRDARTPW